MTTSNSPTHSKQEMCSTPSPALVENEIIELRVKDRHYKSLCQMQFTIPIVSNSFLFLTTPIILLFYRLKSSFSFSAFTRAQILIAFYSTHLGSKISTPNLYPNINGLLSVSLLLRHRTSIFQTTTKSVNSKTKPKKLTFPSNNCKW